MLLNASSGDVCYAGEEMCCHVRLRMSLVHDVAKTGYSKKDAPEFCFASDDRFSKLFRHETPYNKVVIKDPTTR